MRHYCQNCGLEIHWSDSFRRWFHVLNLTTFCIDAWGHTVAIPSDLELTSGDFPNR
jgi:hypothetical protein